MLADGTYKTILHDYNASAQTLLDDGPESAQLDGDCKAWHFESVEELTLAMEGGNACKQGESAMVPGHRPDLVATKVYLGKQIEEQKEQYLATMRARLGIPADETADSV